MNGKQRQVRKRPCQIETRGGNEMQYMKWMHISCVYIIGYWKLVSLDTCQQLTLVMKVECYCIFFALCQTNKNTNVIDGILCIVAIFVQIRGIFSHFRPLKLRRPRHLWIESIALINAFPEGRVSEDVRSKLWVSVSRGGELKQSPSGCCFLIN